VNWKSGPPGRNATAMASVTASVATVKPSAIHFTIRSRARRSRRADGPGVSATTTEPASGIAPATVSHGNVLIGSTRSS
jgi:hypothetical protein